MVAPTVDAEDEVGSSGDTASLALTFSAMSPATGETIIAAFTGENTTDNMDITVGGTYTDIHNTGNFNMTHRVKWKESDGMETGFTVTKDTASSLSIRALEISGADDPDTNPPEASTPTTANSTSANPPASNTLASDDYLYIATAGAGDTVSAMAAGDYQSSFNTVSGSFPDHSTATAYFRSTATTSDDPEAFTVDSTKRNVASTISVYPAAGGGGAVNLYPVIHKVLSMMKH